MQVTLTSLNPPKCREVSKYKKPELEEFTREEDYEFSLNYFNQLQSSLKEWELSESDVEKLAKQVIDRLHVNQLFTEESITNCLIGQTLNVEIVEGKAVIV
jgi:hypothetical protein